MYLSLDLSLSLILPTAWEDEDTERSMLVILTSNTD